MKILKRRDFVRFVVLLTGIFALPSCDKKNNGKNIVTVDKEVIDSQQKMSDELEVNRAMPRELVYQLLDQKAEKYMNISFNCAQSSYLALEEQFGLDGGQVLKALTPLTGIAERGETCGAVIGPLMVMGLLYGRGRGQLRDWKTYRNSLVPTGKFCKQFEDKYGSTMCSDIQTVKYGRCFKLKDPVDLKAFQSAGATEKCTKVVQSALHMAVDIILDES